MSRTRDSTFGDLLRRLRSEAGLTQEELAERAGLSTRGISDLERGINRWPFRATVGALVEALAPGQADADALWERAARPRAPRTAARGDSRIRLPVPPTPIIGREREEAQALHILRWEGKRLLTLTGTGGVGKTRLALQIAWTARGDYADGALFIPLAGVSDPALAPATVASALGARASGSMSATAAVAEFIGDKEMLLVLDNLEHILPFAPFIADLLAGCPRLKVLATSREPLKLRGEQELGVAPLAVPGQSGAAPWEDLQRVPSITLFLQRAQAIQPDFELTRETGVAVADICRKLEGLPLAIELAAAQVKYLSPHALLGQLVKRLDVLAGGARDLSPRQQTMRDTIAWSYHLLQPREQVVFRHLAVFSGGWTEEAAGAVLEDRGLARAALNSLADKSLLRIEIGAESRYGMLETIREFGLEQLGAAGEADCVRERHARHYLDLALRAEPELTGPRQGEWLDRLETEYDNLREALDWAHTTEHNLLGLQLCVALRHFWLVRGRTAEGRRWTAAFLEQADEGASASLTAAGLYTAGTMAFGQELYDDAEGAFRKSLSIYRDLGDLVLIARVLNGLGVIAYEHGKYEDARLALEEAVHCFRNSGKPDQLGAPLNNMANIALYTGDLPRAIQLYEECLALYRKGGARHHLANTLNNLALAVHGIGDHDRAKALAAQSLALYRELEDPRGQATALSALGAFALDEGADEQATPLILEGLALAQSSGARVTVAESLINLATVEFRHGRYVRAETLARDGLTISQESVVPRLAAYALDNLGDIAGARGKWQEARSFYQEGLQARRDAGDMSGVPDSLERLASLGCAEGAWEEAVRTYATADAIRARLGIVGPPLQRARRDHNISNARRVMGADAFRTAWEAGRTAAESDLLRGET